MTIFGELANILLTQILFFSLLLLVVYFKSDSVNITEEWLELQCWTDENDNDDSVIVDEEVGRYRRRFSRRLRGSFSRCRL